MPTLDVLLYACACRSFWRRPLGIIQNMAERQRNGYFLAILKPDISSTNVFDHLGSCKSSFNNAGGVSNEREHCPIGRLDGIVLFDATQEGFYKFHIVFGLAPGLGQHQAKLRPGLLALLQRWLRSPAVKTRTSTWLAMTQCLWL